MWAAKEAAFVANNGSNTAIREYIIPTYVHIVVSDDGTSVVTCRAKQLTRRSRR